MEENIPDLIRKAGFPTVWTHEDEKGTQFYSYVKHPVVRPNKKYDFWISPPSITRPAFLMIGIGEKDSIVKMLNEAGFFIEKE